METGHFPGSCRTQLQALEQTHSPQSSGISLSTPQTWGDAAPEQGKVQSAEAKPPFAQELLDVEGGTARELHIYRLEVTIQE